MSNSPNQLVAARSPVAFVLDARVPFAETEDANFVDTPEEFGCLEDLHHRSTVAAASSGVTWHQKLEPSEDERL